MSSQPAPTPPAPTTNILDLFFGVALLEQGFTGAQAAEHVRRIQAERHSTSERMASRAEEHADGIQRRRMETAQRIAAAGD